MYSLDDRTLYPLSSLSSHPDWTYDVYTLLKRSCDTRQPWSQASSMRDFLFAKVSEYWRFFPWVVNDRWKWVAAGAAIHDYLYESYFANRCMPLYLVGEGTAEERQVALEQALVSIQTTLMSYFEEKTRLANIAIQPKGRKRGQQMGSTISIDQFLSTLSLTRTQSMIEIRFRENNNLIALQLHLSPIDSIAELVHRIPIPFDAVAFDGTEIWFTSLSKHCYENDCNVLLPRVYTSDQWARILEKQRTKDTILPNFALNNVNLTELRELGTQILFLPGLYLTLTHIRGCQLSGELKLRKVVGSVTAAATTPPLGDEDDEDSVEEGDVAEGGGQVETRVQPRDNVECLLNNDRSSLSLYLEGPQVLQVKWAQLQQVVINSRMVRMSYQQRRCTFDRLSYFVEFLQDPSRRLYLGRFFEVSKLVKKAVRLTVTAHSIDPTNTLSAFGESLFQRAEVCALGLLNTFDCRFLPPVAIAPVETVSVETLFGSFRGV